MDDQRKTVPFHSGQGPVPWSRHRPIETLAAWGTEPQMSPGRPPWEPPEKTMPTWAIVAVVVGSALLLLCGATAVLLTSGPDPAGPAAVASPVTSSAAEPTPETDLAYKAGMTFRSGDFQFTVHGHTCGIEAVGAEYLRHDAQGSFCRLDITARNVTRTPHFFSDDGSITVSDAEGRTFSADGEAGIYGNKAGAGFLEQINPGNQVRALVFFDLPQGAEMSSATFNAGVFTLADDVIVRF